MSPFVIGGVLLLVIVAGIFLARRNASTPKLVSKRVPMDELIRKMKEPKDVGLLVGSDGTIAAYCKACKKGLAIVQTEQLIWFSCPQCKRVTFNPIPNFQRDFQLAKENGGIFEYEIFYLDDLPPELKPPHFDYAAAETKQDTE